MVIIRLKGGLGNQMFQYAFGRRLALEKRQPLKLDHVSGFDADLYRRTYALGVFNIQEDFAQPADLEAVQHELEASAASSPPVSWWQNNVLMEPVESEFQFEPRVLLAPDALFVDGYWQNEKWFAPYADAIKKEFTVREGCRSPLNLEWEKRILDQVSVAIHCRRLFAQSSDGANVNPGAIEFHGASPIEYYRDAMRFVLDRVPEAVFFVFADDLEWAQKHVAGDYPIHFIAHNRGDKAHEDLRLMSLCKHHVIANSSFSWWGAWLAEWPGQIVVAPRSWLRSEKHDTSEVLPARWHAWPFTVACPQEKAEATASLATIAKAIEVDEIERAEEAAVSLLRQEPLDLDAWNHLGLACFLQGRWIEALRAARLVFCRDPENAGARQLLDAIENQANQLESADIPQAESDAPAIPNAAPSPQSLESSPPRVSVVIPCYKQADLLPEAVRSVVAQTFSDWEVIVVNDGSPDSTSQAARELIDRHPDRRIRLLEKPNGGLSDARNAGIRAARGQYILPLDADDLLKPAFLEKTVAVLDRHPKIAIAYTDVDQFGVRNELWRTHDGDPSFVLSNTPHAYCALYRKETWEAVGGYNRNMVWGYEDWDFWVGCYEKGFRGKRIPEPLMLYRTKAESMVSKAKEHDLDLKAQIVKNHPQLYDARTNAWADKVLKAAQGGASPGGTPPSISVVLPTYNRPAILARCLDGFANQTIPREKFEVVIVDDGSEPKAEPAVQPFRSVLNIVYRYQPNSGLAAARNAAIELAQAPLLALHDDDDVPAPDYLEKCLAFHQHHPAETDILLAQVAPHHELPRTAMLEWAFDVANGVIGFPSPDVVHGYHKFFGGTSSCKASIFRHGLYDPEYRFGYEDLELAFRLSRKLALRVHYRPDVVSHLVRSIEFSTLFKRLYREGRSLRRFHQKYGQQALELLPPEMARSAETTAAIEPKLRELLRLVRKMEADGPGSQTTITIDGRLFRGTEALKTAYAICARYARARGWLDFATGVSEKEGLDRITSSLDACVASEVNVISTPSALPAQSASVPTPPRALVYFHSNLYPPRSGAHRRAMSLLTGLRRLGYDVTLVSSDLFTDQPWSDDSVLALSRDHQVAARVYYGTAADRDYINRAQQRNGIWGMHTPPGLVAYFRGLFQQTKPDVVLINYAYCAELIASPEFASAARLVEMHDLVSLSGAMARSAYAHLGRAPFQAAKVRAEFLDVNFYAKLGQQVDAEEYRRYGLFDCVTAISNVEADLLRQNVPNTRVAWVPSASPVEQIENTWSDDPVLVVFTNPFNLQGYLWFVDRVLPRVRKAVPGFTLRVIGDACGSMTPVPGVRLLGYVPDLKPLYTGAKFALCPLIGGTGQQVKIVEAMAHGVPVVALANVAASSPIENGVNGIVASDEKAFADWVIRLYTDAALRSRMGEAARQTIAAKFSPEALTERLRGAIAQAQEARQSRCAVPAQAGASAKAMPEGAPAPIAKPSPEAGSSLPAVNRREITLPVRWLAPFFNPSGYASEAINFVLPLSERVTLGIHHHTKVLSQKFLEGLPVRDRERLLALESRFAELRGGIAVSHNLAPGFARLADAEYHIGRTMFESDRLPPAWVTQCNRMDEVWVPSAFNLETFAASGVERDKLFVVPEAVDAATFDPRGLEPLCLPNRAAFNFLAVFEWCSRKAWDVLLAAYLREFSANDDVCLYLRAYLMSQPDQDPAAAIRRMMADYAATLGLGAKPLPRIEVLSDQVPLADLPRLYLAADCLVAPSCGEGWGRPQHEAMMMGRPVIATNWSGTTEFMTPEVAYLLDFELAEVKHVEPEHWHYRGHRWAHPSEKHLRGLMRHVEQNPAEARAKGARAREHVLEHFSREPVTEIVVARLRQIERKLTTPSLPAVTARTIESKSSGTPRHANSLRAAWEGSFLDFGSLSHVNRELTRQLALMPGVQLTCLGKNIIPPDLANDPEMQAMARRLRLRAPANTQVTVRHAWPPDFEPPANDPWVLLQPWEFGSLPAEWIERLGDVPEVWVYSEYVRRVYVDSGVDPAKVKVVPLGIDPERFRPDAPPLSLPTGKSFRFLFVGGTILRKGADLLLETYLKSFTAADDVCLVIKDCGQQGAYRGQTLEGRIRAAQQEPNAPEILYLTEELAESEIPCLYTACHCLVHPYRGEGFGLPVLEAMACGLPVIVTGGGATDDFADDEHAYRLPALRKGIGGEVGGMKLIQPGWLLEPAPTDLAGRMRWVVWHRNQAAAKGRAASDFVRKNWTWQRSARIAAQRLDELLERGRLEAVATAARRARTGPAIKLPRVALLGDLNEACQLLQQKKVEAAWKSACAAIETRPAHPEGWLLLARIAQTAGDNTLALKCAGRSAALAPGWKDAKRFLRSLPHAKSVGATIALTLPASISEPRMTPRLTVCMIAKNEERFIGRCLESVKAIASQIVLVDTGSTDRTIEIARDHGAETYSIPWSDDFSAARNAALDHARGDWVLVLDADEELEPASRDVLLREIATPNVAAFRLPIIDIGREQEGQSHVPRSFRNAPGLFYVGRIHEQVFSSVMVRARQWNLSIEVGKATLLHHGYTTEMMASRDKIARNLRLLTRALEELPNDPNLLMNLGLELVRAGQLEAGLNEYFEAFAIASAMPRDEVTPELREALLTQLSRHLLGAKRFYDVIRVLESPLARSAGLTASMHFALGLAFMELKRAEPAIEQFRQCLAKRDQHTFAPVNRDIRTGAPRHCLALCLAEMKEHKQAELEFQAALAESPESRIIRLDCARFHHIHGKPVEALHLLHQLVGESPTDPQAWDLGGQIALSQPRFLEFANDWTTEAQRHLPDNAAIARQRAEVLLLRQQVESALELWRGLKNGDQAQRVAAVIICQLLLGQPVSPLPAAIEPIISQRFLDWYRRLVDCGAVSVVTGLNARVPHLSAVLPTAAKGLSMAIGSVEE